MDDEILSPKYNGLGVLCFNAGTMLEKMKKKIGKINNVVVENDYFQIINELSSKLSISNLCNVLIGIYEVPSCFLVYNWIGGVIFVERRVVPLTIRSLITSTPPHPTPPLNLIAKRGWMKIRPDLMMDFVS